MTSSCVVADIGYRNGAAVAYGYSLYVLMSGKRICCSVES